MWLAREKDFISNNGKVLVQGDLIVFSHNKPYKNLKGKWVGDNEWMRISSRLFPNVKYENSPIEVCLITKDEYCENDSVKEF